MKKILMFAIMLLVSGSLFAKSLVYIPTAESCDGIDVAFDYDYKDHNHMFTAQAGWNGLELSVVNYNNKFDTDKFMPISKTVLSGQWQILPELGFIPSVAIGAKDITCRINKTPAFYAVATKDVSEFIPFELLRKLSFTAGISHQSLGVFGGVDAQLGIVYGTFEGYHKDWNASAGLSFFGDKFRIGWKRFNKNNYVGADLGLTF